MKLLAMSIALSAFASDPQPPVISSDLQSEYSIAVEAVQVAQAEAEAAATRLAAIRANQKLNAIVKKTSGDLPTGVKRRREASLPSGKEMKVLLFALALAASMQAANWRAIRRATLAVACGAMVADAVTTMGPSRIELNPLLRRPDGRPAMGRIWAVKAATCGGLAVMQERWPHDKAWATVNIGAASMTGWVAFQNTRR